MLIDCQEHSPDRLYFLLTQLVIPRPIAWVLSDNGNGTYNLAPFSFFNAVSANPPILMFSVGWKDEAVRKDTWVNIHERKDFVVHIPCATQVEHVSNSSSTLHHGTSEIEAFDIPVEDIGWPLPKVRDARVAFLCEQYAIYEIGDDPQALVLGKISRIWINEEAVSIENDRIAVDPVKIDPLARLGASHYSLLGKVLTVKRPDKG